MAEHILVALDKSKFAQTAGELAKQIAAAQASRVTALAVVNVRRRSGNFFRDVAGWLGFEPAIVSGDMADEREEDAQARVGGWAEAARAQGLEAEGKVVVGKVELSIKAEADGSDLLVMGLRGETEERYPGQGGAMQAGLAEHLKVPTLFAVPGSTPLKAVAVGFDGSDDAKHGVAAVRRFLVPLGVEVHGIYIGDDPTVLDELDGLLPGVAVHKHALPKGAESREEALVAKAKEVGAQVLALGVHGQSALRDFVSGTMTQAVLRGGELSVLVAH